MFLEFIRKKGILLSWFKSYLIILIIPLFISGMVFVETNRLFQEKIKQTNETTLEQMRYLIDSNIKQIDQVRMAVELNRRVRLSSLWQNEGEYYYNLSQIVNELKTYKALNPNIEDIYIYYKSIDTVVNTITVSSSKTFYENYISQNKNDYVKWRTFASNSNAGEYLLADSINDKNAENKQVSYIKSLSGIEFGQASSNLVIVLSRDFFLSAVKKYKTSNDGVTYIVDKKNEIIVSSSKTDGDFVFEYDNDNVKGSRNIQYSGKNVQLEYVKSQYLDWQYVTFIPSEVFWAEFLYIRNITIFAVIICVLLGGIIVYFFLRKNYTPIRELISGLSSASNLNFDSSTNEYSFIENAISKTLDEKDEMGKNLDKQKEIQKSFFFSKLFKGKLEGKNYLHDSLLFYDINFVSDNFAVIIFYIDDFENIYFNSEKLDDIEKLKLANIIITNVMEELINQKYIGFVSVVDERVVCLLNFEDADSENHKSDINFIIENARIFIKDNFNVIFSASVSNEHNTILGISNAYDEALQTIEYKMVMGNNNIVFYDEIVNENQDLKIYYPLELEQQLINYVKSGNYSKSEETINKIIDNNLNKADVSVNTVKCFMFDLINTLIKIIDEVNRIYNNIDCADEYINNLMECKNIERIRTELLAIIKNICEDIIVQKLGKNRTSELIFNVQKYIEEKYNDENLSISMIADDFKLSSDYLSSMFKENTGQAMFDYILRLRIEKSKIFLKLNDYTINDVAKAVGYINANSFIRTFKRYEGVTPGQYKKDSAVQRETAKL